MRAYQFPSTIKQEAIRLNNFLGVDFATHESEVESKRSPDAVNIISGTQGSIDKRTGFQIDKDLRSYASVGINPVIYGMINFNTTTTFSSVQTEVNFSLIQVGDKVVYFDDYTDSWRVVKNIGGTDLVLKQRRTNFINLSSSGKYILVQNNYISNASSDLIVIFVYHDEPNSQFKLVYYNLSSDSNVFIGDYAVNLKIPTTSIGRSPTGAGTTYEPANGLVNKRINAFLSDTVSTSFYTDYSGTIYNVSVTQMQVGGTFSTSLHDASNNPITYTVTSNRVTFSAIPHATYQTGVDNIKITFTTASSVAVSGGLITRYDTNAFFGLNGNRDYLFMTNDWYTSAINYERWMNIENGTTNAISLYMGEFDYSQLGSNRKIGYSRYGDYLVLHADKTNIEPTLYLKSASLDDAGEIIFPNRAGISNIGAVATRGFGNLRDDPLWVSEAGIDAIVTNNVTGVQSTQDRGFFINNRLLDEPNIENAVAFVYDNKYFVCINSHLYIADSRMRYTERKSYSESFQYDWYYWEGIDVQSYYEKDNVIYFGTSDGLLCHLKNENDVYPYADESLKIASLWQSGTLYSVGDIAYDVLDGNYYVCIKEHGSGNELVLTNVKYWNPIIKDNERSSYQLPVIAYWNTPVLNMNDITVLKTLKNLWVRIARYSKTSVEVFYKTGGNISLVKSETADILGFDNIDFNRFTFNTDDDPAVIVTNRMQRKFMSIQFKFQNSYPEAFSLLEIVAKYTVNSRYKG